jgi:hypothetical protein
LVIGTIKEIKMILLLGAGASKRFEIPPMRGEDGLSRRFEKVVENDLELTGEGKDLYSTINITLNSNNLEDILTVLNDLEALKALGTKNKFDRERHAIENPSMYYIGKLINNCEEEIKRQKEVIKKIPRKGPKGRRVIPQMRILTLEEKISLLDSELSKNLKLKIIKFIKKECDIDEKIKLDEYIKEDIKNKYDRLFKILENKFHSFNIFTTNYDSVIETYFRGIDRFNDFFDGFTCKDPRICDWQPEGYNEDYKFKLFKLHGSVDQYYQDDYGIIKTPGLILKAENAMIYPMREKEVYKEPFFELFTRFKNCLVDKKRKTCIVIGYSFRDKHIRNIFFDAVKRNPEIRIILIDPTAKKIGDDLEPIKDNIDPIEGEFGEEKVFEELKQKLS